MLSGNDKKASLLPRLGVYRPVTTIVTFLAILVVGLVAYQQIPIELLPSGFNPPFMGVWIPYRNANPQEIEEQIARPVEEQLRTISGIKKIESYSQNNGCWVWLEFNQGTDMELAYDQLRDRMERARTVLPDDLERYFLRKFGRNDPPVIFLSISLPGNVEDPYYLVEHYIKRPIERIDGVANIDIWGAYEKVIQILVDQDKIRAYNINLFQTINKLRNDNFAISSGWVEEGGKKFLIRSMGKFRSLDDIRNIPLNEKGIRLGDVAEVVYDVPEKEWYQRINRKPAFKLEIQKESLANTVALSHELKDLIKNEISRNPVLKNAEINILFAQGELIEDSIDNLFDTALWGGLFALLVIYFFLRRVRITLIMTVAIPLSVLISLTVIYFIGWTMNTITMMGLMVSVGMVVDNAIVVLENIYRKRNEGLPPKEASISGASEVSLAVTMATLTTIVVFLPMILIEDRSGFFSFYLKRVGLPVIFALLASLFVALVLIPLTTTRMISSRPTREVRIIGTMRRKYQELLALVLRRRMDAVVVILLILVVTFGFLMPNVPRSDSNTGNISDFFLRFDLPQNYTLEDANEYFKVVEDTIFAHADRYKIKAVDTRFRKTRGRIRVFLQEPEKLQWYHTINNWLRKRVGMPVNESMDKDLVLKDIKERLPLRPGITYRTSWRGSSEGGDEGTVSIMLYGDDTGKLVELSREVERRLRLLPGVLNVETDREDGGDEIKVLLNRDIAQRNEINPNQVAFTVMYAVRGMNLPRFHADDKEIEIRVQYKEEDRQNLEQLKNMSFVNRRGRSVPLSAIADFQIEKGFGQIPRENGKTFLAVQAKTTRADLNKISRQIDEIMQGFEMPFGYRWEKGRRFRSFDEQNESFANSMKAAVIFVFLLMGILFESFVLPLSVLIAIPLSLFGAYLFLYATGTPQDVMSGIGLIILVGVVVNNAIVLVDMINRRRKEGLERTQAILDAGAHRFRPILMTSFTTIGGLLPMALGNANLIGTPYAPMGITLIGGLFTSTLLTLLAVPVLYTLFDDLSVYFQTVTGWLAKYRQNKEEPVQL
ncbi:MAG: efflux RND transporter permease subunit [Calditrichia bacterium]